MAAPVAAAAAPIKKWAIKKGVKLAKKYGPPVFFGIMVFSLGVGFAIVGLFASFLAGSQSCSSGATDLAVLATNGPINVGDKVPDPLRPGGVITITEEMMGNAQAIVRAGIGYKPTRIPDLGLAIAIATAFPESGLINIKGGDRDSVGLFQQRPSQGWGSVQEILDPIFASNSFYRAMLAIPNWQTRPPGDVAADVQRPAKQYRYKYALFMPIAAGLTTSILGALQTSGPALNVSVDENRSEPHVVLASANLLGGSVIASLTERRTVPDPPPVSRSEKPNVLPKPNDAKNLDDKKNTSTPTATIAPPATDTPPGQDCVDEGKFAAVNASGSEPGPNGTTIPIAYVEGIGKINATIAGQVTAMLAEAAGDGVKLTGSAYRSHARQIQLRTINGCPSVFSGSSSTCRVPTAIPGQSQHEYGLAIDFDNCRYQGTACFQWLAANASRFGMINFAKEPWHWSTTGR